MASSGRGSGAMAHVTFVHGIGNQPEPCCARAPTWLQRKRGGLVRSGLCRSVKTRLPAHPDRCGASLGALIEEVRFAPDSPLEEDGFELSVPLASELVDPRRRSSLTCVAIRFRP